MDINLIPFPATKVLPSTSPLRAAALASFQLWPQVAAAAVARGQGTAQLLISLQINLTSPALVCVKHYENISMHESKMFVNTYI